MGCKKLCGDIGQFWAFHAPRNAVVRKGSWVRIPPLPPRRRKLHIACGDFFGKSHRLAHCAASPFPKKGHAAPLRFACKHAHSTAACYQPFSGMREFNTHFRKPKISFLCAFHSREPRHAIRVWGFFIAKVLVLATEMHLFCYIFTIKKSKYFNLLFLLNEFLTR